MRDLDYAEQVKALREGAEWAEKLCAHETAKRQSDAADAIEELLAKIDELLAKNNELWIQLHVEGRSLIEELSQKTQQLPTWISVEDALPDLGQKVFTLGPRGALDCGKFIGLVGTRRTDWKDSRWQRFGARKIRFWMPTDFLPAPPKGGVA